MSYRTLLCAGAALGIFASTAVSESQQQQQIGQRGQQAKQLLQDLEGNWDIQVHVWSMQDAQREGMSPGARPGTQPGQQPGQQQGGQQLQQIQQQIQQAMTQAGVDQQDARTEAQRLAQQFVQQRPQAEQIRERLQQAMTQAGVDQQQAQLHAQRLSQQIARMVQQDRPGLTPREDDTTYPPGSDRPGQQQREQYNNATLQGDGSSTRSWVLDENILEEEVDFSVSTEAPADRPGGQFGQQRDRLIDRLREEESLQGQGLFGFDEETGHLYHVWADSSQGKIFYSVGEYNAQQRTVTFHTADPQELVNGMTPGTRPGITPGTRPSQPGARPGQQPGGEPGAQISQQQPGQPVRPGERPDMRPGQQERSDEDKPRVILRIIDDNEHVVEYYRANSPNARAVRTMVITYTKNN